VRGERVSLGLEAGNPQSVDPARVLIVSDARRLRRLRDRRGRSGETA